MTIIIAFVLAWY